MQTSQTASCYDWWIWQTVNSRFPVRILSCGVVLSLVFFLYPAAATLPASTINSRRYGYCRPLKGLHKQFKCQSIALYDSLLSFIFTLLVAPRCASPLVRDVTGHCFAIYELKSGVVG
jgi:hypothetical protein